MNIEKNEKDLIIQALLFGSSADIISDWSEDDASKLLELAIKIKGDDKNINIDKLQITKENNCDNLTKVRLIKEHFDIKEF